MHIKKYRRRESNRKRKGGKEEEGGVRSCLSPAPLRNKRGNTQKERVGVKEGRATQAPLPRQSEEGEIEREKQAGQGPAVGPDPYGAAGSRMNSEWSGWALGCWNLPPSLCEQDDQRQEGALQMAQAINR